MCATASSLPKMVRKHQTPEHAGIEHGADRVARLPVLRLLERQDLGAPFVFAHLEGAHRADADDQRRARPQQHVAGLERRQTAATAAQTEPMNIGQKFWHMESTSAA